MSEASHLAFALDYPTLGDALSVLPELAGVVGFAKVGLELFLREGNNAVRAVRERDVEVFLDLKLHDIPATVERAVAVAAAQDVQLLTIHASGGPAMLEAAVRRAEKENPSMKLVAVTVLTSLDQQTLARIGVNDSPRSQVLRLASMAWESGIEAFVCSPHEARALRELLGDEAFLVTPGIRMSPAGSGDDQKRVATPESAIQDGADLLVVGRPIRDASSPRQAAEQILARIRGALSS